MRTRKFRGKVYGTWHYVRVADSYTAKEWESFWAFVDRQTVGEWTGLFDKNGFEVYEGDIVRCQYAEDRGPRFVDVVEWYNCEFKIGTYGLGEIETEEVIGTIYDTPELLNNE